MKTIGVLGAGSWGTALAIHIAGSRLPVRLWARRRDLAEQLERERTNSDYLPGAEFPPDLRATSRLEDLTGCEVVLAVVPSHGFRQVVGRFFAVLPKGSAPVVVSATKGIETETLARMSRVTAEEAAASGHRFRFATLAGPSFAAELASGFDRIGSVVLHQQSGRLFVSDEAAGVVYQLEPNKDLLSSQPILFNINSYHCTLFTNKSRTLIHKFGIIICFFIDGLQ